jgi:hypothetical protein
MANLIYPIAKKSILDADIDMLVDTIKLALVSSSYVYSAAHDFYNDISAYVIGTPQTLANKSTTGGLFDADSAVFSGVSTGQSVKYALLYKDNAGNAATSPVIALFDTMPGLPLETAGGDITISIPTGAFQI